MTDPAAPNAVIYARISSDKTGAGLGVARQEQDCRALADRLGWQVARVLVDNDVSAYSGAPRKAYAELLDLMKSGTFSGVLTWHTDRLHRSPRELETYIDVSEAHNVTTQTVRAGEIDLSTPSGRAVARTLGAWARYESEHKSERITRKKLELAKAGKFSGGPVPYGWHMVDGHPVIVEADAAEIRKATTSILTGRSIGSVVDDLNRRGVTTRRGQVWTSTSLRNLVNRARNAGLSIYKGEVIGQSVFPLIITEDEYWAVKSLLENPERRTNTSSRVRHLLSGIVRCGACGAAMTSSSRGRGGRRDTEASHYYKCPTPGPGHVFQNMQPLEDLVEQVVIGQLSHPDAGKHFTVGADAAESVETLQAESEALRARLDEAANSYADGAITARQLETITARVGALLKAAGDRLAALQRSSLAALHSGTPETVREWWDAADIEQRRAVIDSMFTIYVDPVGISAARRFDPERVRFEPKGQD
ncbi:recombinase family protein [Pseudarthrobacter sp. S9]|uniref:recombinase family protein n=1 Tax=Pseudarthrobacter sp. S9 TaxID=3418421 RepID=UPI003D037682